VVFRGPFLEPACLGRYVEGKSVPSLEAVFVLDVDPSPFSMPGPRGSRKSLRMSQLQLSWGASHGI
jgi:hypothetical protein